MVQPPAHAMRQMVKKGQAMPAPDQGRPGRFPIRSTADLANAIKAVGRVQPPTEEARSKVRRFIQKRARALGASDQIPDSWAADGSLKS